MGTEQHVCWRMSCDRCQKWLTDSRFTYTEICEFDYEDTMYYQAEKQGWAIDDSYWYCPDCQKVRADKNAL